MEKKQYDDSKDGYPDVYINAQKFLLALDKISDSLLHGPKILDLDGSLHLIDRLRGEILKRAGEEQQEK